MKYLICYLARYRVDRRWLVLLESQLPLLSCDIPNDLIDLIVLELVEDSITTDQDVVKLVNALMLVDDVRLTGNHSLCAS